MTVQDLSNIKLPAGLNLGSGGDHMGANGARLASECSGGKGLPADVDQARDRPLDAGQTL